jgi:hypothetical protein
MNQDPELHDRLTRIEAAISVISTAIVDIARLDQKHISTVEALARVFEEIKATNVRVSAIELALPVLKLTSGWVRAGVVGIIALVGISLIAVVLK